jgi:hypothetical protein
MESSKALNSKKKFIIHLVYICSYFAVSWAVFLLISSFVTFVHLQLDHTLTVVENWNQDQGWEIASLVKIISFFIIIKFISIRSTSRRPLRDFFVNYFQLPDKKFFAVIVFNIFFAVLVLRPVLANRVSFEFSKLISSYLGSFLYISCDILLVLFMNSIFPLERKKKIIEGVFFISLMYFLNIKIFSHSNYSSFSFLYFMLLSLRVSFWNKINWSYLFILLLVCICPMISFVGIDFVWGNDYSYLISTQGPGIIIFLVLTIVSLIYIQLSQEKSDKKTGV